MPTESMTPSGVRCRSSRVIAIVCPVDSLPVPEAGCGEGRHLQLTNQLHSPVRSGSNRIRAAQGSVV